MNRNRELLTSETNEDKIRELQERIALLESQYHECRFIRNSSPRY
ncbi:hypothetical protein FHR92_000212 [Fontibacillus solani]|uniref:Uncharacterized protein n=1 Tax=Fontibacillus solani TaxID=1572857 RepID=A0A7W3SPM6_9BACL|nr:hypothetical protein [Fontibacillus solani]